CLSWRQPGVNDLCLSPFAAYPGTPSKCNCQTLPDIAVPVPGRITTIDKVTLDLDGNPLPGDPTVFDFDLTGPDDDLPENFQLVDAAPSHQSPGLDAGTYSLIETVPAGWTLVSAVCVSDQSNPDQDLVPSAGSLIVGRGESLDCVFTNRMVPNPVLSLAKTGTFNDESGDGFAQPGETIGYSFQVTSTGNVPLTNVSVTDPMVSPIDCGGVTAVPQIASLAVGATVTCAGTYTLTQADVDAGQKDNTATADSDETAPENDSTTVSLPQNPALTLVKTGTFNDESGDGFAQPGETISYSLAVTNTGNVTLTNVSVTDPMVSPIACGGVTTLPQIATLAVGATATCTGTYALTQADVDAGEKVNTATADSGRTGPVNGTETVPLPQNSALALVKTGVFNDESGDGFAQPGETISYSLAVTNTGNVTLNAISVTDPMVSAIDCGGVTTLPQIATLAVGATATCTGTYTLAQADVDAGRKDNTAAADSDQTDPVSDVETVPLAQNSALALVKTGVFNDDSGDGFAQAGETIGYSLAVTNTGDVTLTNVGVTDPMVSTIDCGGVTAVPQIATLAVGATLTCTGTYTVTQADVDAGRKDNTAIADSDQTDPVSDVETVPLAQNSVLALVKTGAINDENGDGFGQVGETILYSLAVTNTGDVTLTTVSVADPMVSPIDCGGVSTLPQIATLAVGATVTCTGTYTVTQADVDAGQKDNTATADSDQTGPVSDVETVPLPPNPASVGLVKTGTLDLGGNSASNPGDLITYTFEVTNTGILTLTSVTISDPLVSPIDCPSGNPIPTLAVGATETCTGVYTLTQADVDAGVKDNTATAIGQDPVGGPVSDQDSHSEPIPAAEPQEAACTGEAFIVQDVIAQLTQIDQSISPFTFVDVGVAAGIEYNNMGFRRTDGLLYAVQLNSNGNTQIIQVDLNGVVFGLGRPSGLPTTPRFDGGDVSTDGSTMYITASNLLTLYLLDLTQVPVLPPVTPVSVTGDTGFVFDWAYNSADGLLYGGDSTDGQLAVLDPATGARTDFSVADLPAGTAFGGSWFNAAGQFFIYRNNGEIYEIDLATPAVAGVQTGPGSARNDGASCIQDVIGAAKRMTPAVAGLPGSITIDYLFENFRVDEDLFDLAATDDLTQVFGVHGVDWTFTSIASVPGGFANPTFDGHQDTELIHQAPNQSLAAGATATVTVVIEILNLDNLGLDGSFCNQVLVVGETAAGTLFGDLSTAGSDPDPDANGSPDERELACADFSAALPMSLVKALQSNADEDGSADVSVGDTLTYSMVATNVAAGNLTNVAISDPLPGLSALSCTPAQPAVLSPGSALSCTAIYAVTAADAAAGQIFNTAMASSDQTPDVTDSETVAVPAPVLELEKSLQANADEDGSADVSQGDTLTYGLVATNAGTANLFNVTISDPLPGLSALSCTPAQPAALSPGSALSCTATYVVTATDAAVGQVVNTATASSDPTSDVQDGHSEPVVGGGPMPFLCDGEAYLVRNADAQLTRIDPSTSPFTLVDVGPAAGIEYNNLGFRSTDGLLYAVELSSSSNVQILRIDATGTVTGLGRPPGLPSGPRFDGGDVSSDGGTMYITAVNRPLYRLDLTSVPTLPAVTSVAISGASGFVFDWAASPIDGLLYGGDSSHGQLAILDPATGSRTDVNLVDTGLGTLPAGTAFGGAWFDAAGRLFLYRNGGEIYAVDLSVPAIVDVRTGGPGSSRNDSAACVQDVIGAAKQMAATADGLPETITIDYVIENLSVADDLSALSATDDLAAVFGVHGVDWTFTSISSAPAGFANPGFDGHSDSELVEQAPAQSLLAGASATVAVVLEVLTFANLDAGNSFCNQVQVRGETAAGTVFGDLSTSGPDPDPDADGSPDERQPACVGFSSAPAMDLVKALQSNADEDGSGEVSVGDTLTYGFVATNVGLPDLTNVVISDPLPGLSALACTPAPPASLASGSALSCTATYVVTAADVTAGQIFNTATASSDQTPDVTDSETVAVPTPLLELVKSLQSNADEDGSGDVSEGDTLTYGLVATNAGTANLANVTISDPLPGLSALSCTPAQPAALSPGSALSCTATYVVTAADVTAGQIFNTATASSDQTPDVEDSHSQPVAGGPMPFPCDGEAYLVRNVDAQLTRIDQSTSPFTLVDVGPVAGIEYNNLGFRSTDGFLYAVQLSSGGNVQILRIDATGTVTGLGRPPGLPSGPRFDGGDVSSDGGTMY
ncbi:MAG: hypothetical protein V3T72_14445, partial [Thermoanaerobaculia bacterium]